MFELTNDMTHDINSINSIFNSEELNYHKSMSNDTEFEFTIKNHSHIIPLSNQRKNL